MSKSNIHEEKYLKVLFQAIEWVGVLASPAGGITNLYAALHTADPGEGGSQTTNEVSYGGYARVAIPRSTAGWDVVANAVTPKTSIDFPAMVSGSPGTATHISFGTMTNGAGEVLYKGALTPPVQFAEGTVPRLRTNSTITED